MKKHRKFQLEEGWYSIQELPKGEFIKRGPYTKKVYRVGKYDRHAKAYEMDHMDDISMQSLVRGNTKVWAGFTY